MRRAPNEMAATMEYRVKKLAAILKPRLAALRTWFARILREKTQLPFRKFQWGL